MERVSGTECREGMAVMSNKEEKECQITKVEKGRKNGKKHKDKGQGGDCEGKAVVMSNKKEKGCQITKGEKGWKKGKKRKDKGRGGDCDSSIHSGDRNHSIEMEQADVSATMAENPCLEHAEGAMSKSSVKKHRKKKKKDKEVETNGQNQVLDPDENVGSEDAERNNREREHDRKSKKCKRKHQDDETASSGSSAKIVLGKDKRRKKECLVTWDMEEGNKSVMSKIGKKTESNKKRRKERNNVGVDLRRNAPAGEGKNGKGIKERKMCEDENDDGEREKENMAKRKDKGRRVSFTDDVEVFNIGGSDDVEGDGSGEIELVHGRRFTSEEDAKLMEAMVKYAEMRQLGEKGLEMIGDCKKYPELKGCWPEIAKSLPHRPTDAVYKRARILLQRSAERKWTEEEREIVRRFVEKNGRNWRVLAKELGKNEIHVKDLWRRMKPKNLRRGHWTQDEYQNLFDLVNLDLRMKAHQYFDPGHRQIRDNISWEAISDKLTTRNNHECCQKWYLQLASPLVKEGIWADKDDYLLVEASGELCRQRWNQMVRLLGGHRDKPFIEQVEVLARRYCPEMLPYRESKAGDLSAGELAGGSDL
ncbi:hypothetical protein SORBI_3007G053700 [Sorghum bicolor]|uniref:Uncharacterized protein n=1 Tax=Sorghum bicolor TaxID=4558 RepID=A0A1Z5R897_SORBI|nr:hypothetical protein SORBI_3007G053700 [Sorghum bicolor]